MMVDVYNTILDFFDYFGTLYPSNLFGDRPPATLCVAMRAGRMVLKGGGYVLYICFAKYKRW